MFCPKCKSIMLPKKVRGKTVLACSCGYVEKKNDGESTVIKEGFSKKEPLSTIDKKAADDVLPTCEAKCPKCEHNEAYYWMVQTRAGDEAETKFLKCKECGHTWREYD